MSEIALNRLVETFRDEVLLTHREHGDETATVSPRRLVDIVTFLREDPTTRFEMLMDLTGLDMLGHQTPRFWVVIHLYSLKHRHRLRLKVPAGDENPSVPSLTPLFKSALWMEREAWDLYGIRFEGHPDLRRVLLYPEFEGHPLRKDYPLEKRQPLIPPWPGREHL